MAHKWFPQTLIQYPILTSKYVDQSGTTALLGADGTPDNPFNNIPDAVNAANLAGGGFTIVLGEGTYTGSFNTGLNNISGESGRGLYTIIDLGGALGTFTSLISMYNLTVRNGGTAYIAGGYGQPSYKTNVRFLNVTIQNIPSGGFGFESYIPNYVNCEFINVQAYQGGKHLSKLDGCKLINTTIYHNFDGGWWGCYGCKNTDVDTSSNIQFTTEVNFGIFAGNISYNNYRGQLMFADGTNSLSYKSISQALIDNPTVVQNNNINADPLYNNVSKLALTVYAGSPNLGKGQSGFNIGNVYRAKAYFCDIDPELTDVGLGGNATLTNLVGTTDKTVDPLQTQGEFNTGVIVIDSTKPQELGIIHYIGRIATDSVLGGTSNEQVPDNYQYNAGNAANRPERLDYEMMWSTSTTLNFDNQSYVPANTYSKFIWGEVPKIDSMGRGNADPDFDQPSSFTIAAKYIKIKGKITRVNWNISI